MLHQPMYCRKKTDALFKPSKFKAVPALIEFKISAKEFRKNLTRLIRGNCFIFWPGAYDTHCTLAFKRQLQFAFLLPDTQ